ncbi:hypothetical protein [Bifidobacterium sp. SO1]|uniref:hypothetical protein n=1 Tax=Bifidobacterium sp. SO1 TaxID=2809029 RepID=UPI001BDC3928|nr:hypothetical protein [Bifidobacterium sp. SO1]MBT1162770.1 hypothetical protein [Bifidobacterium sp. SO1]
MSLISNRAVFCRFRGQSLPVGRQTIGFDKNTRIRYNWQDGDSPSYFDLLLDHANKHHGRLLIPFNNAISIKNVQFCSSFILWSSNGQWIMGRIRSAGQGYVPGMDDGDGYTTPENIIVSQANLWVKLSDVTGGDSDFPLDDYTYQAYEPGVGPKPVVSLREALKRSNFNVLFINRKDD